MKNTKRISIILNLLKKEAYTANEILSLIKEKNIDISIRQLQRDINELENFLENTELLSKNKMDKKIFYSIIKKSEPIIDKINFHDTKFYYPFEKQEEEILFTLNNVINQKNSVQISIKNDLTGDNSNFEDEPFVFFPISIVQHRNLKYIGGWNPKKKLIQIFGINQINELEIQSKKFKTTKIKQIFYEELNNRFGVTKNIDNNVYLIKIEISKVLADFIKSHSWHKSQKIKTEKNKSILTLECGINRELISWLFQWLYNIRIIEPKILRDYYNKTLNEMNKNNNIETPIFYKNIFVEKEK